MTTRVITSEDISEILTKIGVDAFMDEIITGINRFCQDSTHLSEVRPRDGFHYSDPHIGLLEWMPTYRKGKRATIKIVGYHPENPKVFAMPTIVGSIGVYDTRNGAMLVLADGTLLTAMRTGAASAAASAVLADPQSATLGIIGCGVQAITQCHALMRCFPIERILGYDCEAETGASFAKRLSKICSPAVRVEIVPQHEVLSRADILCTCTSIEVGEGPLFEDSVPLKSGLHINAVGSDFPGKTELPRSLLQRARVIPDHREQCIKEGECQQLPHECIGPELSQLIRDRDEHQHLRQQLTVFDSTGWAAEDQIVMDIVIEHAERLKLGTSLSLHSLPEDPLSPY